LALSEKRHVSLFVSRIASTPRQRNADTQLFAFSGKMRTPTVSGQRVSEAAQLRCPEAWTGSTTAPPFSLALSASDHSPPPDRRSIARDPRAVGLDYRPTGGAITGSIHATLCSKVLAPPHLMIPGSLADRAVSQSRRPLRKPKGRALGLAPTEPASTKKCDRGCTLAVKPTATDLPGK
jgi:hypothetical protein